MPSGLVFVAIVVIWAVILAPRAVRLYERGTSVRTSNRFRSAMGALGGSQHKSARASVVHSANRSRAVDTAPATPTPAPAPPSSKSGAVARRRRAALVLCLVPIPVVIAGVVGMVPLMLTPVAALPAVGFLFACSRLPLRSEQRSESDAGPSPMSEFVEHVVPASRRFLSPGSPVEQTPDQGATAEVVALPGRSHAKGSARRGRWAGAREVAITDPIVEQNAALAATYTSVEQQLGLDQYVNSPSDVDGRPYRRAANE